MERGMIGQGLGRLQQPEDLGFAGRDDFMMGLLGRL
jgi:hypothetical protein